MMYRNIFASGFVPIMNQVGARFTAALHFWISYGRGPMHQLEHKAVLRATFNVAFELCLLQWQLARAWADQKLGNEHDRPSHSTRPRPRAFVLTLKAGY